jgi:NAD(P)-dependent dehydrogenase (short-subunit alcohol dehydrogenase family)
MDLGLKGQVVLITGGSKGLGLTCARQFIEEGARVAITSRSHANLDAARAELGAGVVAIAADLADAAAAARVVEQVEATLGPIDVLVTSAGAAKRTAPDDLDPAAWRAAMDAKFFTYINVIDPLVKRMATRGRGVIVNIIGNGGKSPTPTHLAGGAANAALMLVTAGLATTYAPRGVRVVGVNPGLTQTTRVAEGLKAESKVQGVSADEALRRIEERIPAGRIGEPGEIADMVLFLASARASYTHGAIVTMDGASAPFIV